MSAAIATLSEDLQDVREYLLDLYLDVKVRSNEEVMYFKIHNRQLPLISFLFYIYLLKYILFFNFNDLTWLCLQLNSLDDVKLTEERRKLSLISCKVLIDYIRSSIEILLNLKAED